MTDRPDDQPSYDHTAPIVPHASEPATPAQEPAPTGFRRHLTGTRVKLGAAAAAIFVVGGAGGFGLAHAVSHDDRGSFGPGRGPGGDGAHGDFRGPGGGPPGGQQQGGQQQNGQQQNGQQNAPGTDSSGADGSGT